MDIRNGRKRKERNNKAEWKKHLCKLFLKRQAADKRARKERKRQRKAA